MSVVVERDLRRPPRRQAEVPELSGSQVVHSPAPAAGQASSAGPGSRSRARLLRDGQHYRRRVAGCSARSPVHRWPATVTLALVLAAGITGLGLSAQGVAGMVSETAPVPDETAVVVVRQGETLWGLAREYAPESATAAVVDHIQRLNELAGQGVAAGTPLVVPVDQEIASAGE